MNPSSPKKRSFQVWREGYAITGGVGHAYKFGEVEASSFKEACGILLEGDESFDPVRLSWWACHLYPTEVEARSSFG